MPDLIALAGTNPEPWQRGQSFALSPQVAVDVLAQKYFRRAGVPKALRRVPEEGVPEWLWRSEPDEAALADLPRDGQFGRENDARQVFDRLAGTWTYWGHKCGYFDSEAGAKVYYDEMRAMRRTARSGSTPACIGRTASPARRRATTTSTRSPARRSRPRRPSKDHKSLRACRTTR